MTRSKTTVLLTLTAPLLFAGGCAEKYSACEESLTCGPSGDGDDGDTAQWD